MFSMNKFNSSFFALIAVFFLGCEGQSKVMEENTSFTKEKVSKSPLNPLDDRPEVLITNVVKVFFHQPPAHYSVMSMGKDNKLIFHDFDFQFGEDIQIYTDVPSDQSQWVTYKNSICCSGLRPTAEIHIHTPDDLNGAGWRRNGGHRGTTIVIQ